MKITSQVINKIKEERGVVLLSVFIVSVMALIISGLIVESTVEQMQTTYRNIRSSAAFAASQTGIEDALLSLAKIDEDYADCLNDPGHTAAECAQSYQSDLEVVMNGEQECNLTFDDDNRSCKWTLTQDAVVGSIPKDYAVTFDMKPEGFPEASTGAKDFYWECPDTAGAGSALVITQIVKEGDLFKISDNGKTTVMCSSAPPNIHFDSATDANCAIGVGGGLVPSGKTTVNLAGNIKYLRIRAVGNDVKNLNILESGSDCSNIGAINASFLKDASGTGTLFPLRDVITSEGVDEVSRITKIARSRDLKVPSIFDFVLYTDGDITK